VAAPQELIQQVPLFSGLDKRELQGLASSMKERVFDEGEATVSVQGEELKTLGHGDYFGEVALIDDGARTATITAKSPLKCYGITSWEFKPMVEQNADLAWKMLQTMAKMLRASEKRAG